MRVAMPGTVVTMSNEETPALIRFVSCRWMGEGGGTVLNFGQALKKVACSFFCSLFAHFELALKKQFLGKMPKKGERAGPCPSGLWLFLGEY